MTLVIIKHIAWCGSEGALPPSNPQCIFYCKTREFWTPFFKATSLFLNFESQLNQIGSYC